MNTIIIVSYALAFLGAASRLLPLTKPFWNFFPKVLQASLPSILAAIPLAIGELTNVKTPMDLTASLLIIAALFVPGASSPHNHPELPPPDGTKKSGTWPPLAGTMLMAVLAATCLVTAGCGNGGAFWPPYAHCVPTPSSLLTDVTTILEAGGDYETALEQLALKQGKEAVYCAVETYVAQIGASVDGAAQAKARGRAFLASSGTKGDAK